MKNRAIELGKNIINLGGWIKEVFKKKQYSHLDNVEPILNLLTEGNYEKLPVSQRIELFLKVEAKFKSYLAEIKIQEENDIKDIDNFFSL